MRQEIIETDEKRNDLESYILTMRDPVLTANIVPFVRLACFLQGSERTSPDHFLLLLFFRDTFSTAHHVVPIQGSVFRIAKQVQQKLLQWLGSRTSAVKEVSMVHSSALEMLGALRSLRFGLQRLQTASVMFSPMCPLPLRASGSREA